jgi:hypothetical protein
VGEHLPSCRQAAYTADLAGQYQPHITVQDHLLVESGHSMTDLEKRVREALNQMQSYWYLYLTKGHAKTTVKEITPLVGPLYRIKVELVLWEAFTFDALYLDGEQPGVFIDAYMLSHFSEHLIKRKSPV